VLRAALSREKKKSASLVRARRAGVKTARERCDSFAFQVQGFRSMGFALRPHGSFAASSNDSSHALRLID
jgi:hypothetical protein